MASWVLWEKETFNPFLPKWLSHSVRLIYCRWTQRRVPLRSLSWIFHLGIWRRLLIARLARWKIVQTIIMGEEQNNLAASIRQSFTKLSNLLRPPGRKFCTICYTFCEAEELHKIKHCGCSFCKTVSKPKDQRITMFYLPLSFQLSVFENMDWIWNITQQS